jgi:hypothetical protein
MIEDRAKHMTPQIVPCRIRHLHALAAAQIREEELREIALFKTRPRHALMACYRQTPEPWACVLDDGGVAAVWGDTAPVMASEGNPWCFTSKLVERIPLFFFREVRRQLAKMLDGRQTLRTDLGEDCLRAQRFYRAAGFSIADPDGGLCVAELDRARFAQRVQLKERASQPPFIIYALPRSRTAWLSAFLTYGQWRCRHEIAIKLRSIGELKAALAQPFTGYAETAAGPAWHLIHHYRPDIRAVVVRRPVEDTMRAMIDAGEAAGVTYDQHRLRRIMTYEGRCLEKISNLPGVMSVEYADLEKGETCRDIFEFCLPYHFDYDWWEAMRQKNIQVDLNKFFRNYEEHRSEVEKFKHDCWIDLRRIAGARETVHA